MTRTHRIMEILDIIRNGEWWTAERLATRLEVSVRSVYRYMAEIEDYFSPLPILEAGREGYRRLPGHFHELTELRGDLAALGAAAAGPAGAPLAERLRSATEKMTSLDAFFEGRQLLDRNDLETILRAMLSAGSLFMEYHRRDGKREILPVRLKPGPPFATLVAWDYSAGKLKSFSLDRMTALSAGERYDVDLLDKLRKRVQAAWGSWIDAKPATITARISGSALAELLMERPLHPAQTFDPQTGIFTLPVHSLKEFVRFILQFGRHIRILAPRKAVLAMEDYLMEMHSFYAQAQWEDEESKRD